MSGLVQLRNDELVELLSADFQRRYEPNFAWKSCISQHLALTSLRGLWTMSSVGELGNAVDYSEQARLLTNNNTVLFNYEGLAPYADFNGTNESLSRTDEAGLDITGTETHIATSIQGLTIGCWFRADTLPGTSSFEGLMTKWNEQQVNERSYGLWVWTDGSDDTSAVFYVSNNGTATTYVSSTASTVNATTWYFVAGRFDNSGNLLTLWLNDANGILQTYTQAFTATIHSGTADFYVGAEDGPVRHFDGRIALCFLAAASLGDATVWSLYQQSRAMFGV